MTKKQFTGWTNHETWSANLLIYIHWQLRLQIELVISDLFGFHENDDEITAKLAGLLESFFDDNVYDIKNGFQSDLQNKSMQEVNFHEIARHLVNDELEIRRIKESY